MEKPPDLRMVQKNTDFILNALRTCEKYYIVPETIDTPKVIFFRVFMSKTNGPDFCAMDRADWERLKYEDLSLSMKQVDRFFME